MKQMALNIEILSVEERKKRARERRRDCLENTNRGEGKTKE